jgi:hypothetical protein
MERSFPAKSLARWKNFSPMMMCLRFKRFFFKKKDAPFAWVLCEFLAGVESDAKQCNLVPGGGK